MDGAQVLLLLCILVLDIYVLGTLVGGFILCQLNGSLVLSQDSEILLRNLEVIQKVPETHSFCGGLVHGEILSHCGGGRDGDLLLQTLHNEIEVQKEIKACAFPLWQVYPI